MLFLFIGTSTGMQATTLDLRENSNGATLKILKSQTDVVSVISIKFLSADLDHDLVVTESIFTTYKKHIPDYNLKTAIAKLNITNKRNARDALSWNRLKN